LSLHPFMSRAACGLVLAACAAGPLHAQKPEDFAWRGTLETPPNASLVRAALPAEALIRLQHPQAHDLRVFDANGQPVPFAFAQPVNQPAPPRQPTTAFRALPLYATQAGAKPPKGSVQVRVQDGAQRSVWVQMSGGDAGQAAQDTGAARLPSALFDTRANQQTISAIVLKGQVPANAPTRISLSTSADLAQWEAVPVRGRWYHFEGEGAPSNDTLELQRPLQLKDRYLRVEWHGQDGVRVDAVTGLVAPAKAAPPQVKAPLPEPRKDGNNALEWELGFATPLAALELGTPQKNVLVPVRILGRNRASEPWRLLGQTVVYRLTGNGTDNTNPAAVLYRPSVRQLRVEATHGARLEGVPIAATAVFDPVELVFVSGGTAPYRVAVGAAIELAPAALPLSMVVAVTSDNVDALPHAKWAATEAAPARAPVGWERLLPAGTDPKSAVLWTALLIGVLVLGAVAWRLFRQMGASGRAGSA